MTVTAVPATNVPEHDTGPESVAQLTLPPAPAVAASAYVVGVGVGGVVVAIGVSLTSSLASLGPTGSSARILT